MDVNKLNASIRDIRMPTRMSRLPINERGYPVPYFVAKVDGRWDFRVGDREKFRACIERKLCWLCGDKLGQYLCFVVGPMCVVNLNTAEPPCHLDCAAYAARACPFLANPRMRRNEVELPEHPPAAGEMLTHNPGVIAIWITKNYRLKHVENGVLFDLGKPINVLWYTEGRPAGRGEVLEALYRGLPQLEQFVYTPKAKEALMAAMAQAMHWLPKEDDRHPLPKEDSDAGSLRHGEPAGEGLSSGEQSPDDGRASEP